MQGDQDQSNIIFLIFLVDQLTVILAWTIGGSGVVLLLSLGVILTVYMTRLKQEQLEVL